MIPTEIDENEINQLVSERFSSTDPNIRNKIEPIHPQINFYYNSFNICLGKQGSGKTTFMLKELIKLTRVNSLYNCILYIAPTQNDYTFESLRSLIGDKIPIYHSTFPDSIELLSEYFNKVKNGINHIFIIIEDGTFLLSKETSIWFTWICSLRHLRATVWVNLHTWKGINPMLKTQVTCMFVLKGFSREQMQFVYRQCSCDKDFNTFCILYANIDQYEIFSINNITGKLKTIS